MRKIFRGLDSYGPGTPSEQATRFRLSEMLPEIIERARENSPKPPRPPVDLLVSLSGFSPATTVLAFELVQPERLLVISSTGTDDSIDVIHDQLVGSKLRARYFRHEPCDGTNPLEIYRLVKEEVARLEGHKRQPSVIIDITGGKKVMSAAAALVAWQLDLRLCYIDSRYDAEMRQPIPGTERLLILENPTTIFGDQEMEAALHTFKSGAFAVAHERFAELAESISQPTRARLLRDVSGLYQAWSDLDFPRLAEFARQVRKELADPLAQVSVRAADQLSDQLDFITKLADSEELASLPNFYVLGEHYREFRRMDFGALLFYRTIEGCIQQRLALRYDGFDCSRADYRLLGVDTGGLLDRFNSMLQQMSRPPVTALPVRIGLMDSAVLLWALDDELLHRLNIRDARGLSYLQRQVEARNRSVLAHGQRSVTAEQCDALRALAQRCLRGLWSIHRPDEDVDALCSTLRFVRDI